jgi:hypothetical protein
MGSGAMMYIPGFIKIGSGIQKLIRGIHRHTDNMEIALKSGAHASDLLPYAYINFLIPSLLFTA